MLHLGGALPSLLEKSWEKSINNWWSMMMDVENPRTIFGSIFFPVDQMLEAPGVASDIQNLPDNVRRMIIND